MTYQTEARIHEQATEVISSLAEENDRLKALCEELARLCEKALTRSAIVHPGFADEIRAALKKAQKP